MATTFQTNLLNYQSKASKRCKAPSAGASTADRTCVPLTESPLSFDPSPTPRAAPSPSRINCCKKSGQERGCIRATGEIHTHQRNRASFACCRLVAGLDPRTTECFVRPTCGSAPFPSYRSA
ncbi:hypothetical protein NPIL_374311 [Nephila pilipes]|uniref:Uncharacterized protein n=1 Tax=Nephila pilipes TaxID=299642 RepID=A0A8X6NAN1_NEPPI|nr:hypothetical protein NPIL_374311 [Nephila pilipes]